MRHRDHERIMREVQQRHAEEVEALQTDIKHLQAAVKAASAGLGLTLQRAQRLAYLAVQDGLAVHAVYKVGAATTLRLFQDDGLVL